MELVRWLLPWDVRWRHSLFGGAEDNKVMSIIFETQGSKCLGRRQIGWPLIG